MMNFKKMLIPLFAGLFLFLSGCGDTGSNPDNSTQALFPLAVGNSWTSVQFRYSSKNKDSLIYRDTTVAKVFGIVNNNDDLWYLVGEESSGPSIAMRNKAGLWGIKIKDISNIKFDSTFVGFKYPTHTNDINLTGNGAMITLNTDVTVKTPAGTFHCIEYFFDSERTEKYYISPGIGYIKTESIGIIDDTQTPADTIWIGDLLLSYKIH